MTLKLCTVLLHWGLGTILNFSGKSSEVQIREYFHMWSWEKKTQNGANVSQQRMQDHTEFNCFFTYGFILNRSRMATLALASRLRMRSVNSLSFVQVMWTLSGSLSALSLMAACDAVFLSWMSWAWSGGKREITQEASKRKWAAKCRIFLWRHWGLRVHNRVTKTLSNNKYWYNCFYKLMKGR